MFRLNHEERRLLLQSLAALAVLLVLSYGGLYLIIEGI